MRFILTTLLLSDFTKAHFWCTRNTGYFLGDRTELMAGHAYVLAYVYTKVQSPPTPSRDFYMVCFILQIVSLICSLSSYSPAMVMSRCCLHLSHLMGTPTICIGKNKVADQLRSNCEADQRLCFHYMDSTIPLLSKSKISSL